MRVISFHTSHDANLSITEEGQLRLVLELERLFDRRYFASSDDPLAFEKEWRRAVGVAQDFTGIADYDVAATSWVPRWQRAILGKVARARSWRSIDHHQAHAFSGFWDSGFSDALILSYDGGGNDGTFRTFRANSHEIRPLRKVRLNLGTPYRLLATAMPEVTGGRPQEGAGELSLAGKVMAYASLGSPRAEWLDHVRDYYLDYFDPRQALFSLGERLDLDLESAELSPDVARDLAATSQSVFETLLLRIAQDECTDQAGVEGLVLVGGGALNVIANQRLRENLDLPIHVPPFPNDSGISLGAAWAIEPPATRHFEYSGLPLRDPALLTSEISRRDGRRVDLEQLASYFAAGLVIGVARGRSEIGPRALGHRSILCYPADSALKERLNNRVKFREWYRPFAPLLPLDRASQYIEGPVDSPFMSFCSKLRPGAAAMFPAVAHVDATARPQTVTPEREPWLYALLESVGKATGHPILLNTSFNTKGKPILGDAETALQLLDSTELDAVLLEDHLVLKSPRRFLANADRLPVSCSHFSRGE